MLAPSAGRAGLRRGTLGRPDLDRRDRFGARAVDAGRRPAELARRRADADAQRHRRCRARGAAARARALGAAAARPSSARRAARRPPRRPGGASSSATASWPPSTAPTAACTRRSSSSARSAARPAATDRALALRVGLHSGFVIAGSDAAAGPQRGPRRPHRRAGPAGGEILVSSKLKEYTESDPSFRFEPRGRAPLQGPARRARRLPGAAGGPSLTAMYVWLSIRSDRATGAPRGRSPRNRGIPVAPEGIHDGRERGPARAGSVIAGYRIEELIGRGGMGLVYRVTNVAAEPDLRAEGARAGAGRGRAVPRALQARDADRRLAAPPQHRRHPLRRRARRGRCSS